MLNENATESKLKQLNLCVVVYGAGGSVCVCVGGCMVGICKCICEHLCVCLMAPHTCVCVHPASVCSVPKYHDNRCLIASLLNCVFALFLIYFKFILIRNVIVNCSGMLCKALWAACSTSIIVIGPKK